MIRTTHGTLLQRSARGARIVSVVSPTAEQAVLIYIPTSAASIGFLLSQNSIRDLLQVTGDPATYRLMPVRLQRQDQADNMAICHHLNGRYLAGVPFQAEQTEGDVLFGRDEVNDWERFYFIPVDLIAHYPDLYPVLEWVQNYAATPLNGCAFLSLLERGLYPDSMLAFDTVARLLPHDQLSWLAAQILQNDVALDNLASAYPADMFAQAAIPGLARWLAKRPPVRRLELHVSLDGLASSGIDGGYTSFAHMCNAYSRRTVANRNAVAVVATARNEGLYLLEWIAYHRAIGVGDIFLYSNDNDDGSDALLAALADGGAITWITNSVAAPNPAQPKAYGHALSMLPQLLDSRWTLIIDLDEFFAFDAARFSSISEYAAWQEARPVDAVVFNWLVYGSGGALIWSNEPMIHRFVHRLPWIDQHVKTMVRSNLPLHSYPHHPTFDMRQTIMVRNASGALHQSAESPAFSAHPEASLAWVNHYFLKSAEEFIWKFSRNRGDHPLTRGLNFLQMEDNFTEMFINQHDSKALIHDDRIARCATGMDAELAKLNSLPGVREAADYVVDRYVTAMHDLKAGLRNLADHDRELSPRSRLMHLLG